MRENSHYISLFKDCLLKTHEIQFTQSWFLGESMMDDFIGDGVRGEELIARLQLMDWLENEENIRIFLETYLNQYELLLVLSEKNKITIPNDLTNLSAPKNLWCLFIQQILLDNTSENCIISLLYFLEKIFLGDYTRLALFLNNLQTQEINNPGIEVIFTQFKRYVDKKTLLSKNVESDDPDSIPALETLKNALIASTKDYLKSRHFFKYFSHGSIRARKILRTLSHSKNTSDTLDILTITLGNTALHQGGSKKLKNALMQRYFFVLKTSTPEEREYLLSLRNQEEITFFDYLQKKAQEPHQNLLLIERYQKELDYVSAKKILFFDQEILGIQLLQTELDALSTQATTTRESDYLALLEKIENSMRKIHSIIGKQCEQSHSETITTLHRLKNACFEHLKIFFREKIQAIKNKFQSCDTTNSLLDQETFLLNIIQDLNALQKKIESQNYLELTELLNDIQSVLQEIPLSINSIQKTKIEEVFTKIEGILKEWETNPLQLQSSICMEIELLCTALSHQKSTNRLESTLHKIEQQVITIVNTWMETINNTNDETTRLPWLITLSKVKNFFSFLIEKLLKYEINPDESYEILSRLERMSNHLEKILMNQWKTELSQVTKSNDFLEKLNPIKNAQSLIIQANNNYRDQLIYNPNNSLEDLLRLANQLVEAIKKANPSSTVQQPKSCLISTNREATFGKHCEFNETVVRSSISMFF